MPLNPNTAPLLALPRTSWAPLGVGVYFWLHVSSLCSLVNYVYLVILCVVGKPPLIFFFFFFGGGGVLYRTINP